MKKILFVANVAKEHILKFHVPTIKHFKELGWQVDVACSGPDDVPFCDNHYKTCWKRSPFTFKTIKGIKQLKKIISDGQYDIIYCHTPVGGLVARIAASRAKKKDAKVIYFAHGLHFYKGGPKISWLFYYNVEKYLSKKTDKTVLINKEDYELVKNKFSCPEVFLVNGIGIDLERLSLENRDQVRTQYRQQLSIPQDATVLIYCAELLKNKNQSYLLRVLKKVLEKDSNVYLLLAGIDHCGGEFEKYAKKLGIYDHVRFLGWRNDIANLYVTADICTPTSIREGFGINLVEAMYLKIPVVATINRGHITIINDGVNGFLADLDNEDLFAQRVLQLINDKELKQRIVKTAFDECEKYTCESIIKELEKIID